MIKPNELRIGNWLWSTSHEQFFRVQLIDKDREIINAEPIRLTEEWLLKFGFELLQDSSHWFRLNSFSVKSESDFIKWYGTHTVKIEFVHQLQNLYFCLCGTELELKEGN